MLGGQSRDGCKSHGNTGLTRTVATSHILSPPLTMALADFLDGQNFVDGYMNLFWDGRVYEIDPKTMKIVRLIDSKIRFTNGIAFDHIH